MFDLHTHSYCSDGEDAPSLVVEKAKDKGLDLFALTDHDTVEGLDEAEKRAKQLYLPLIKGCEIEASYMDTLHILALGIDTDNNDFKALMEEKIKLRDERNIRLSEKLKSIGMDVSSALKPSRGATTRANFAAALVELGYAQNTSDAFARILGRGMPGFVSQPHPKPQTVVEIIEAAGGLAVVAHPMKMKVNPSELIADMKKLGIRGVEAFYGTASEGETRLFAALAKQNGLFVTCGSDYHGKKRPSTHIGKGWQDVEELKSTEKMLLDRLN